MPPVGIDAELQTLAGGLYDMQIGTDGDILSTDNFDAALIVSLLTDRRANESEVLEAVYRRGWIGNESTPGIEIGSKIWLFEQSRLNRTALDGIEIAARDALQWLIDDGHAVSIVSAAAVRTDSGLTLEVTIERHNSEVETRFFDLWTATGVS